MAKKFYENPHTGDLILTDQLGGSLVFTKEEEDELLAHLLERKLVRMESVADQRILQLEKENKKLKRMLYPWK